MGWKIDKAKFKVGDIVHFPYGRKIGKITSVGAQVTDSVDGRHLIYIGMLYRVSSYDLTESQIKKVRKGKVAK